MKSLVVKRSIIIGGRETSVSLEDAFWDRLKEIAGRRQMTLSDLVTAIDSQRQHRNLSSALRLFVLDFYCAQKEGVRSHRPTPRAGKQTARRHAPSHKCGSDGCLVRLAEKHSQRPHLSPDKDDTRRKIRIIL
jgi:predicted DNA-binding ribbon-helix-helix protein